jgi:hypothetical protein
MRRILFYKQLKPKKNIPYGQIHLNRMSDKGYFPKKVRLGPITRTRSITIWLRGRVRASQRLFYGRLHGKRLAAVKKEMPATNGKEGAHAVPRLSEAS